MPRRSLIVVCATPGLTLCLAGCLGEPAPEERDPLAPLESEPSLPPDKMETPAIRQGPPPAPLDPEVRTRRLAVRSGAHPEPLPEVQANPSDEPIDELAAPRTKFADGLPPTLTSGGAPRADYIESNGFHDQFGHAMATGDFTSSGKTQLVIAAPYDDDWSHDVFARNIGGVYLFERTIGPDFSGHSRLEIGGSVWQGRAGWALAAGDFNGDGFDDLAVAQPFTSSLLWPGGVVYVFRGEAAGLRNISSIQREDFGHENELGDHFGSALAVGDFDNDGIDDLAIGAPGVNEGRGRVYWMRGLLDTPEDIEPVLEPVGDLDKPSDEFPYAWERVGASLAAGDITGSAHDDLVVGAYANIVTDGNVERVSGSVFLYRGDAEGLLPGETLSPDAPRDDDDFGRAIAVADFDADGWEDIAVGAPGRNRSSGEVWVYNGASSLITHSATLTESLVNSHYPTDGERFGAALAAGTLDMAGGEDLVVGAPREKTADGMGVLADNGGRVFTFGVTAGVWGAAGAGWRSQAGLGSNEAADRFGASIAIIEEGAAVDGVAVGAPSETLGNDTRTGAVFLYSGGLLMTAWDWLSKA